MITKKNKATTAETPVKEVAKRYSVAKVKWLLWQQIQKELKTSYMFSLSYIGLGNMQVTSDEVYLCVTHEKINYALKVLKELNNENITLCDTHTELKEWEPETQIPIWLYIGGKYNNCLLIDSTSFNFRGATDMDADIDNMRRYPCISFSLIEPATCNVAASMENLHNITNQAVNELRSELAKRLNVDGEKFVTVYTTTEDYHKDKRPRINVYLWQSASSNPPQFNFTNAFKVYER